MMKRESHPEGGAGPMREFLVEITTAIPDGTPKEEVDRRRAAEAVRARELAAAGHLGRLWRPVGELRSKVLASLPLSAWMTFTVTALEPHPNDPGPSVR
jgi:muconolactone D-isomerase